MSCPTAFLLDQIFDLIERKTKLKSELLRVEYLYKTFQQSAVLNHITFRIFEGETLVILGASGSGKTTLAQILGGLIPQDDGKIFFQEEPVCFHSLREAQALGIHIVQYSGRVVDALSINENIFIAHPKGFWIRKKKLLKRSKELTDIVSLPYDPSTLAKNLSPAEKPLLELAAVLNENPKLLIIDEPTFPSTKRINNKIFTVINKLKASGPSTLYFTQNIHEAMEIGDRILVLTNGVATGLFEKNGGNFNEERLLMAMAGDNKPLPPGNPPAISSCPVLEVRNLSNRLIKSLHLSLYKGEILGIVSPMGGSKKTLLQLIYGHIKKSTGTFFIDGKQVEINDTSTAIKNGIAYYATCRENSHLVTNLTVMENITLMATRHISSFGWIKPYIERHFAKFFLEQMNIPEELLYVPVRNLNYGMQQRIQFVQCLIRRPKIMLLYEPLSGIDIGAKNDIEQAIRKLADQGMGMIMASSHIEDMLKLCDRFIVMIDGQIKGEFSGLEASQSNLIGLIQK